MIHENVVVMCSVSRKAPVDFHRVIISESNTKPSSSDDHLLQTIEDLSRQVYCLPAQNETMGLKQNSPKCGHRN